MLGIKVIPINVTINTAEHVRLIDQHTNAKGCVLYLISQRQHLRSVPIKVLGHRSVTNGCIPKSVSTVFILCEDFIADTLLEVEAHKRTAPLVVNRCTDAISFLRSPSVNLRCTDKSTSSFTNHGSVRATICESMCIRISHQLNLIRVMIVCPFVHGMTIVKNVRVGGTSTVVEVVNMISSACNRLSNQVIHVVRANDTTIIS